LRSVLDRLVDDADTPIHMVRGTLAHGFAEAIARGADSDAASALVYEAYAGLLDVPAWQRETALREWDTLIDNLERWLENTRGQFEQVGVEMDMRVSVGTTESGAPLRIKGRMDRLERNNDGELVVVDVKTGSSKPAQKNMGEHAQLSAYQLALSRGVVDGDSVRDPYHGETPEAVGGGVLVYPSATDVGKYTTREQAAKTPEELEELAAMLPGVAAAIRGPALTAIVNDNCDNCRLQSICPAQPTGRMLTNGS
jgi:helicase